jgi:hypothetical protein
MQAGRVMAIAEGGGEGDRCEGWREAGGLGGGVGVVERVSGTVRLSRVIGVVGMGQGRAWTRSRTGGGRRGRAMGMIISSDRVRVGEGDGSTGGRGRGGSKASTHAPPLERRQLVVRTMPLVPLFTSAVLRTVFLPDRL